MDKRSVRADFFYYAVYSAVDIGRYAFLGSSYQVALLNAVPGFDLWERRLADVLSEWDENISRCKFDTFVRVTVIIF